MKLVIVKLLLFTACFASANVLHAQIKTGAENINDYLPLIQGKKIALVVNNSSRVGNQHLIDTLISLGIKVQKIFTPEHGLKGNVSAGEKVANDVYGKTKIPVISLYGEKKKPLPSDLNGIELLVFDMQDMGVRFFTYISTLAYVMEACAENAKSLLVLDRPNPHAGYIDGPVLKKEFTSFVGLHPVPVVYGMTIGEYALMINGEAWLKNQIKCNLKVIKISNYNHDMKYYPNVPPSPNLRTAEAMLLYPSLCFFEGTDVSVGRGTDLPFEVVGKPGFMNGNYHFTPVSIPGVADKPLHEGKKCSGFLLTDFAREFVEPSGQLYLHWLIGFYDSAENKSTFFNSFFDKLAGNNILKQQIIEGRQPEEIQKSWENELAEFQKIRKKYLLYPDFTVKVRSFELTPKQ